MNTPLTPLTAETFRKIIGNNIASVNFTKKDGSERKMQVKLNVTKHLHGGQDSTFHKENIVNVYEMCGDAIANHYRKIDMTRVNSIKAKGVTHIFKGE